MLREGTRWLAAMTTKRGANYVMMILVFQDLPKKQTLIKASPDLRSALFRKQGKMWLKEIKGQTSNRGNTVDCRSPFQQNKCYLLQIINYNEYELYFITSDFSRAQSQ